PSECYAISVSNWSRRAIQIDAGVIVEAKNYFTVANGTITIMDTFSTLVSEGYDTTDSSWSGGIFNGARGTIEIRAGSTTGNVLDIKTNQYTLSNIVVDAGAVCNLTGINGAAEIGTADGNAIIDNKGTLNFADFGASLATTQGTNSYIDNDGGTAVVNDAFT